MSLAKKYPTHVPLRFVDRVLMTAACSVGAIFHPENNNYIVGIGEMTAYEPILRKIRDSMLRDKTGRQILRERPRITSQSLDLAHLESLPSNTVGRVYFDWLKKENVSPDTREPVRYIDDEELAYVFQRYRECHDFHHAIGGLPVTLEGEIAIKAFEFANFGFVFAGVGTLLSPWKLPKVQRQRLSEIYIPWAMNSGLNCKPLINVYWEKELERDVDNLRKELELEGPPPDLRFLKQLKKRNKQNLLKN